VQHTVYERFVNQRFLVINLLLSRHFRRGYILLAGAGGDGLFQFGDITQQRFCAVGWHDLRWPKRLVGYP